MIIFPISSYSLTAFNDIIIFVTGVKVPLVLFDIKYNSFLNLYEQCNVSKVFILLRLELGIRSDRCRIIAEY